MKTGAHPPPQGHGGTARLHLRAAEGDPGTDPHQDHGVQQGVPLRPDRLQGGHPGHFLGALGVQLCQAGCGWLPKTGKKKAQSQLGWFFNQKFEVKIPPKFQKGIFAFFQFSILVLCTKFFFFAPKTFFHRKIALNFFFSPAHFVGLRFVATQPPEEGGLQPGRQLVA